MTDVCKGALSDKEKILNVFSKQLKKSVKKCHSVYTVTADCKCLNHYNQTAGQHKKKRMKTRKERSQMSRGAREASRSQHHHHCLFQTSKDSARYHNCRHRGYPGGYPGPPRRDALFPNVVPAAQEPSIITDSRLIGHQGLFNHEVKSIDIERLVSEQRKLEKSRQQVQGKSKATSRPSSKSGVPSTFTTIDLLRADTDEVIPYDKGAGQTSMVHDGCLEKENKTGQGSDLTPGQRPQQQCGHSSGCSRSVLPSKHSSFDVVIVQSGKTNPVMSEKDTQTQLTLSVDGENVKTFNKKLKENMISTLEQTPKIQDSPVLRTQAHGLSPSPLQVSRSHTADRFGTQHRRRDPDCVSMSVNAVAAGLCDSVQFPFLRRRSLVAESRELLLKALWERHGPQLQENLLKVQGCISFGTDSTKEVQDQQPTMEDAHEILPTDPFPTVFQASTARQPQFDHRKTPSFKLTSFNWKSSPKLHHIPEQTPQWLTSPAETSVSLLDDILKPTRSPQFCMNFEPSGVSARDHWFAPSPTSCLEEKPSTSHHWEENFNRPKSKEADMLDSFQNSFLNPIRAVTERRSGSQYNVSNIQPIFHYQTQLPDKHPAEPMNFHQEQDRFETDRYCFGPSFSTQILNPQQSNNFQPFRQCSHPSICPSFRSHYTDMKHYPPSHMLERDPVHPLSSFPSPEHWSFPPMRLY